MRVLYVGPAQAHDRAERYYFTPEKLINGFIRAGHMAYVFDDRAAARAATPLRSRKFGTGAANRLLLKAAADFRPDLVLIANAEDIRDATLAELRRLLPGVRLAYRNVDSLLQRHNAEKIRRKLGQVDGIFVTTGDPAALALSTAATFVDFMPNPIDASIEDQRAFAAPAHNYDLFFAGHGIDDREDTRQPLVRSLRAALGDLRLGFFGDTTPAGRLYGRRYIETLGRARIGLSLDREDEHRLYASGRMAQYLGNGLLTAVRAGKGFERYFTAEEVLFFGDAEDLCRQVRRALADDLAWRARAEAAWRKAQALFCSTRVAEYMLRRLHADGAPPANPWLEAAQA